MKNAEALNAPFPYFGGKSKAAGLVWDAFGTVSNYVEPFAGSAAMLLRAPSGKRVETINDKDGFVANFWRGIALDPDAVAHHADWPCNETDLFARHSWLVRQAKDLTDRLHGDPDYFDAKIAGYWVWGLCNWIGGGWCSGAGPWVHDGETLVNSRELPHLGNAGKGINRQLPHLSDAGVGVNRKLPHLDSATGSDRRDFIFKWFGDLHNRLRDVRVTCGDWSRVVKESVTVRHGLTAVFLDPPYAKGAMDYAVGGVGTGLSLQVQSWCVDNGANPRLRIVICGHAGENDILMAHGWTTRSWIARKGYALSEESRQNSKSETIWCSPHCVQAGS